MHVLKEVCYMTTSFPAIHFFYDCVIISRDHLKRSRVNETVFILQHLLQPSIITSGLWLIWEKLKSMPSIPWSCSVFVFVVLRMAITHYLKCTVLVSFVVPLLSLAVTHCHLLSLVVTRCHSLYHLLSFVVTRCHSLSLVVPLAVTRCHSMYHSFVFL